MTKTATTKDARAAAETALLDAAERLLVDVGHAGITTRRLAEEAGVNHGLVHYYFGSNENLLVRALERFTERLITRQRELYAADEPFVEKWRTAMRFLVDRGRRRTRRSGWSCRRSPGTTRACVSGSRGSTPSGAPSSPRRSREPHRELGLAIPLDALVSLVITFNLGVMVERLGGIETGHAELLDWIDGWLSS